MGCVWMFWFLKTALQLKITLTSFKKFWVVHRGQGDSPSHGTSWSAVLCIWHGKKKMSFLLSALLDFLHTKSPFIPSSSPFAAVFFPLCPLVTSQQDVLFAFCSNPPLHKWHLPCCWISHCSGSTSACKIPPIDHAPPMSPLIDWLENQINAVGIFSHQEVQGEAPTKGCQGVCLTLMVFPPAVPGHINARTKAQWQCFQRIIGWIKRTMRNHIFLVKASQFCTTFRSYEKPQPFLPQGAQALTMLSGEYPPPQSASAPLKGAPSPLPMLADNLCHPPTTPSLSPTNFQLLGLRGPSTVHLASGSHFLMHLFFLILLYSSTSLFLLMFSKCNLSFLFYPVLTSDKLPEQLVMHGFHFCKHLLKQLRSMQFLLEDR